MGALVASFPARTVWGSTDDLADGANKGAVSGETRVKETTVPDRVVADMPSLPDALWADNARVRDVLEGTRDFERAMPF